MHIRYATSIILLTSTLLGACSSVQIKAGHDFDLNAVSTKIERGVTTKAQLQSWLGTAPSTGVSIETNGIRYEEWIYYYVSGTLPANPIGNPKFLQIKFDKDGVVQGYNWTN